MKDPELDILIKELETQTDLTVADFDGVAHGMAYLLPDAVDTDIRLAERIGTTDEAMRIADDAFPDWSINSQGPTNDKDGHWTCTLRENDPQGEAPMTTGRSPILAQAVLAATMRLAMTLK
ncbi:hypothetical protein [Falsihalocynthiibacter arcticus]|uniref:Phage ABA sandwich domain-containing protein n=1 Tax=Falsihalocynthiibacter arcticus TaxID=1579316 RepID=A0A126V1C2_9RHOB|nr:hypothetical protein [Falsihalocynthiibacter arcticus]AML51499.1 hypothetical protein RC74_09720 [Falsihalocynthiibacter arcticus]